MENCLGPIRFTDKITVIDGNTASIVYNSGGANIGYCSNPTGDITLSVTGIPTSSFDNQALTFSLIVDNSTAAAAGVKNNFNFCLCSWTVGHI